MDTENLSNLKSFINNSTFYRAVIEDNEDPLKLNRVKVRIFGVHSDDNSTTTTDSLAWAEVIAPLTFGLSSGVGVSAVPNKGTYVWVFFDGDGYNKPIVFGATYGVSREKETGAFTDPSGEFPKEDRLCEPDTNRLARVENLGLSSLNTKTENLAKGIPISSGATWNEPIPLNAKSKYPNNTVIETKTGHIVEFDDTPGNERIHVYHRTGSYIEMLPDGSTVQRTALDKFEVISQNLKEVVYGDKNSTVFGSSNYIISENSQLLIGADKYTRVSGSVNHISGGATTIIGSTVNINP